MFMENRQNRESVLHPFRTPRDDAPKYSSDYWDGQDYSYIHHLTQHYVQELRANKEQSKWSTNWKEEEEENEEGAVRAGARVTEAERHNMSTAACETKSKSAYLHTYPETKPSSWLARLLYYIAPSYFQREQALRTMMELQQLSSEELLELMQMTLAAGEMERSSEIARELSLRRVNLTLQPVHTSNRTNAGNSAQSSLPQERREWQQEAYGNYKDQNNNDYQGVRYGSEEHCINANNNISPQRANCRGVKTPYANTRMKSQQSHWH